MHRLSGPAAPGDGAHGLLARRADHHDVAVAEGEFGVDHPAVRAVDDEPQLEAERLLQPGDGGLRITVPDERAYARQSAPIVHLKRPPESCGPSGPWRPRSPRWRPRGPPA